MTRALIATAVVIAFLPPAPLRSQDRPFQKGDRTRGLIGGVGLGYQPPWAPTESDVAFAAFHPRLGWFVEERLELYGEGTLFLYGAPQPAVSAGAGAIAARYHLRTSGSWIPYIHGGAGLLWTTLNVIEIDRTFNFQHFVGIGWRQHRARGPRLVLELRNHHISNAGTDGDNLGVNALVGLAGIEWIVR